MGKNTLTGYMYSHPNPDGMNTLGFGATTYERFGRQKGGTVSCRSQGKLAWYLRRRLADEYRDPLVNAIEVGLRDSIHIQLGNHYGFDYCGETRFYRHVNEQQLEAAN